MTLSKTKLALVLSLAMSAGLANAAYENFWDVTDKTNAEISARVKYQVEVSNPRTDEEREADKEVIARYNDALVINTLHVNSLGFAGSGVPEFLESLEKSHEANFALESATVSNGDANLTASPIKNAQDSAQALKGDDRYIQVKSVSDIHHVHEGEKLGVVFNVQGSNFVSVEQM